MDQEFDAKGYVRKMIAEGREIIGEKDGHEVAIACPAHAPIALAALDQGIEVIALPIEKKRLPGLFAMRALLRRRRFDVINTHSSTDTWLVALSCASLSDAPPLVRTRHIPVLLVTHDSADVADPALLTELG